MPGAAPGGVADITLEVTMPEGDLYTTVTRLDFSTPQRRARIATVGAILPVLADPADRSRIVIDTTRLDSFF
jgi:hypothetical protein